MPNIIETEEYFPLPAYPWAARPASLPLDYDEVKTAFAASQGDPSGASQLLKISVVRLNRWVRANPRILAHVRELAEAAVAVAAYEPVRATFDPTSDARRREWAHKALMQTKLAQDHLLAPIHSTSSNAAVAAANVVLVVRWGDGTKIAELGPPVIDEAGSENDAD